MRSLHFLYHELRPAKSHYSYVMPCDTFEAHCDLFARLRQATLGETLQPEVTFDDGHLSDLEYAAPILARHGLRGTFFITAGWTGVRPGFLTWQGLRELQAAGHRIGAHGMTHKLLTECSPGQLDTELLEARKRLEDGLGSSIELMSLPGGRANTKIFQACEQAGYRQIFTSVPKAEEINCMPRCVGRLNLLSGTTTAWLEQVLDTRSGTLSKLERRARLKEKAKQVLGDRLYARLWAIGNRQERAEAEASTS